MVLRRPSIALLPVLAALACKGPVDTAGRRPGLALETARQLHETATLDFGTLAARRQLLLGWSRDEQNADGVSLAWGLGAGSTLRLEVLVPRPLELWFRCWPFAPDDGPPQTVTALLNGSPLGTVTLQAEPASYRLSVPASAVRGGANELELRYAHARRPSEVWPGSTDERSLAVAWDALEVLGAAPALATRSAPGALFVPAGNGVELVFEAEPGARFAARGVEGAPGLELRARATTASGSAETRIHPAGPAPELLLPLDRPGWVALRLETLWESGPAPSGQELRLISPELVGVPPPPAAHPAPQAPRAPPPNVLLYVVDTLRADHLGCYGHPGGLTPGIDALAAESALFERATAASAWTRTSMASVLTGLPPLAHGANRRDQAIAPDLVTLAERLQRAGWETAGLVTNPNLAPEFGFDAGFDSYHFLEQPDPRLAYVSSAGLNEAALEWLDARDRARPFFLYLHSMDPHDPYFAHTDDRPGEAGAGDLSEPGSIPFMRAIEYGRVAATPALKQRLRELYADEIRFNDARFAELMAQLDQRGLGRDTAIVLLSDHGEEFEEHGWWRHGKTLFEEMLHVPFLIRWPDRRFAGRRVSTRVRHLDLVPTLLDLLGVEPAAELPGRSLLPELETSLAPPVPVPAYAWLDLDGRVVEAMLLDDWKLVRSLARARDQPPVALYDLAEDPGESRDRSGEPGAPLSLLGSLMAHPGLAGVPTLTRTEVEIDAQLRERLRAVGYLH